MIKTIDRLLERPKKDQIAFLNGCCIYEKIASYYLHVRILSRSAVKILKADMNEIEKADIILNSIWMDPVFNLVAAFLNRPDFLETHVGWRLSFFYFPDECPQFITYPGIPKYVPDRVTDPRGNAVIADMSDIDWQSISKDIRPTGNLLCDDTRSIEQKALIKKTVESGSVDQISMLVRHCLIGPSNPSLCTPDVLECEGFILRMGREIYQLIQNTAEKRDESSKRLAYEYVIQDFSRTVSVAMNEGGPDFISGIFGHRDYCSIICALFNVYVKHADFDGYKYYGITADDLEPPYTGWYPGPSYEAIPNARTRQLCLDNRLLCNVFKIILAGMRRRSQTKGILLTDESAALWNSIMETVNRASAPALTIRNNR